MGWINQFEQKFVEDLYGYPAKFRCNKCGHLIWCSEMEVVDPKGGYFTVADSKVNGYQNYRARPKVTYHILCERQIREERRSAKKH